MDKWLSIVAIGRNEEKNLNRLFLSLQRLSCILKDIIYVDSASIDDSVNIAKKFGAKVIELKQSPYLSAAAGRYVGTMLAEGEWILYLDGDMEIEKEFIDWLINFRYNDINKPIAGYIGYYKYVDTTRNQIITNAQRLNEGVVEYFGGAVFLNKAIVLQAGNWSPGIVSNEEIEFYSRIQAQGYMVYGLEIPMIVHYTSLTSSLIKIYDLFIPYKGNRKYFGAGQAVLYSIKNNSFSAYFKAWPFPNIFLLADIFLLVSLFILNKISIMFHLFLIIQFILMAAVRYPRKFILFHALAIRIPFGILKNLINKKELLKFEQYLKSISKISEVR